MATGCARRWQALVVICVSLLVVVIGNTILNVALPTVREELGASASQLQWIVDGYLLVFAGLLLVGGSLGDRFGRRRALFGGLGIFGTGSAVAALADTAQQLIAARALMGIGAAAIMPATLSIISNIFPPKERPKAIAVWTAVVGLGVAIGPVTGGWIIEHFAWNVIFLVNLPIVVVVLLAGAALVPESRDPARPRIDLPGAALSVAGLSAIVWGLIEAPGRGWGDPVILGAFAAGAAILTGFLGWERRSAHPMLDVRVFRNRRFSGASVAVGFVFFALMGVLYVMTSYLQDVLGFDALQAGVRMLPLAAGMVAASRGAVPATQRVGTKVVVAGGLTVVTAAMLLLSTATVDSGYGLVAAALALMGTGMGLAASPATEAIMGSLPKAKAGVGSAMNDVVRELGGTLGVAVLGSVLTTGYAANIEGAADGAAADSVGAAHQVAVHVGGDAGARLVALSNQAFVDAMSTTATIAAVSALIGAAVALVLLPARARGDGAAAAALARPAPA